MEDIQIAPGTFVNLKVPPFEGEAQLVQSSDWLDLNEKGTDSRLNQFIKYTVLINRNNQAVAEVYEIILHRFLAEDLNERRVEFSTELKSINHLVDVENAQVDLMDTVTA